MVRQYEIPNNLQDPEIKAKAVNFQKEWASYIKPVDGDIMVLNGSWGPYTFVYYKGYWENFGKLLK